MVDAVADGLADGDVGARHQREILSKVGHDLVEVRDREIEPYVDLSRVGTLRVLV